MKKKLIVLFYPMNKGRPFDRKKFVPSGHAFFLGIRSERIEQRSPDHFELARTFSILTESGLSLKGCSPAEPFSVSPDGNKIRKSGEEMKLPRVN